MAHAEVVGADGEMIELVGRLRNWLSEGVARYVVIHLLLFGIVPLAILTIVFFAIYVDARKQGIKDLEIEIANKISVGISGYLEKTSGEVKHFAHMMAEDRGKIRSIAADLLDQGSEYDLIAVTDLGGKEIYKVSRYYTFREFELNDASSSHAFQGAVKEDVYIGEVEISEFSKSPHVTMAAPIRDPKGNLRGVLTVDVNIAMIWKLTSKYQIGENRYAYIVDGQGRLIAYRDLSPVLREERLDHVAAVKSLLGGHFGVFEYRGLQGDRVIGASASVPRVGWAVVVEEPVAEAFRGLYLLTGVLMGVFVLTMVSAVLLGIRFSFRKIVTPIRRLQKEAAAIATGDLDREIEIRSTDELGQLAQSFNKMLQDLRATTVSRDSLMSEIGERERVEAELLAAKEAAEAANLAKSEFLANTSHEFRTPLNSILGYTQLLLEEIDGVINEEQARSLRRVETNAKRILRLVDEILDLSRIEAGRMELHYAPFDVRDVVEECLDGSSALASQKGLSLTAHVEPNVPPTLIGDAHRLGQVLFNLVENAVKFTDRGEVTVRVRQESRGMQTALLHFSVSDTGIGIAEEKQTEIFKAFVQVDGSTTRSYEGLGLGLAIVSNLVGLMNGRIWVQSKAGVGSTFHVSTVFGIPFSQHRERPDSQKDSACA